MVNRFQYFYFILFVICFSCGKTFLDREPKYYSNQKEAYSSLQAVKSALVGCYDGLQDYRYYGRNFYLFTEVYSDNAQLASTNLSNFSSFYNYSVTSNSTELDGFWKIGYKTIARANNVIDATQKLQNVANSDKNQILGEAYAIRALVYFDLVRVFAQTYTIKSGVDSANGDGGHAGIPIVTKPITEDSIILPYRSSVKKVYNLILNDFYKADSLLPSIVNSEPYTFSKVAVEALLSRVYLTNGSYYKSYIISTNIINSKKCSLIFNKNYINSWNESYSNESLLSIPFTLIDNNGTNSIGYFLSNRGAGGVVASNSLFSLYNENDIRIKLFKGNNPNLYFSKYPGRLGNIGIDNISIIRYSEVFLNCADALSHLGLMYGTSSLTDPIARGLLDTIVLRNDTNGIKTKLSGINLRNRIIEERRKEFAFEGQRFFDLKRTQSFIEKPERTIQTPNYLFAMPIPISEINSNKNIKQNPGY